MATAPSPNDLTRQQLDELDALLQRMLAIPLNQPEPVPTAAVPAPPVPEPVAMPQRPTPPTTNWRVDSPPPAAAAPPPHVLPMQPPVNEPPPSIRQPQPRHDPGPERFVPPEPEPLMPDTVPLSADPLPPILDEPPDTLPYRPAIPVTEQPEPIIPPMTPPSPFAFSNVQPAPAQPEAMPDDAPAAAPAPERRRRVSMVFWPFVALNFTIDTSLRLTGFPGRVLTSWPVKTLLGLTGLGLIAYTAAYVGHAKGWFTLPQPLPWPK